jgi:hypothetical protein
MDWSKVPDDHLYIIDCVGDPNLGLKRPWQDEEECEESEAKEDNRM